MNMRKIRTIVRNGPEGNLAATQRGKVKTNFAQSCEMLQEDKNGADEFSTSHNRTKLHFFFSDFLVRKPLEDLLDDVKCPLDLGL